MRQPSFGGKSGEDADSFIKAFERCITYREITDNKKEQNLLAVVFNGAAADWFDALSDESKDSYDHLLTAFTERYQLPDC